jgi:hypothetical protein
MTMANRESKRHLEHMMRTGKIIQPAPVAPAPPAPLRELAVVQAENEQMERNIGKLAFLIEVNGQQLKGMHAQNWQLCQEIERIQMAADVKDKQAKLDLINKVSDQTGGTVTPISDAKKVVL